MGAYQPTKIRKTIRGTNVTDWRDVFCGRKAELKQLVEAYESVASGSGPRLVVVCADRGMGKTRLVQELYRHLATTCDPDCYWPDASLFKGNNLRVAPDFSDPEIQAHFSSFSMSERSMPFLWWGFRINDPLDRNAVRSDMAGHRRALDPHLERARFTIEQAELHAGVKRQAVDIAKGAAMKLGEAMLDSVPGVGLGKSIFEVGFDLFKTARSHKHALKHAQAFAASDLTSLDHKRRTDIYERTLEDLASILSPGAGASGIPAIVFCDDAQFARDGGDEGALRFLERLWRRAEEGNWPLLMVATHWAVDWAQGRASTERSFASAFSGISESAERATIIHLSKGSELGELVRCGLPDMHQKDLELLVRKADGNPQVLIELVGRVRSSPAWRSPDGGLSMHGRKQIEKHSCNLTTLITERLLSDATPSEVRIAVALSSLQGMQFLCPLTQAAASAMQLGSIGDGIETAAHPLRLVVGVSAGVASFVQRAYRDAAYSLVETHLGDPSEVKRDLLAAAIDLIKSEDTRANASAEQNRALLGVVATLGAESEEESDRKLAAECLVRLVESEVDVASKAAFARRFVDGLIDQWSALPFDDNQLSLIRDALCEWDGSMASFALDQKLLETYRRACSEQPERYVRKLIDALSRVALYEWYQDKFRVVASLTNESVLVGRDALSRNMLTEDEFADHLLLVADLHLPTDALDVEAVKLFDEALSIKRRRFEIERNYRSCESLVDALITVSVRRRSAQDGEVADQLMNEAVDAVRTLRLQPSTDDMTSVSLLGCRALKGFLKPKVTTQDGRFTLRYTEDPGEIVPLMQELAGYASEVHASLQDESSGSGLVFASGMAALASIRAGKRDLAAIYFEQCRSAFRDADTNHVSRSFALMVAAIEHLSHGDLAGAKAAVGEAVKMTGELHLWSAHHDALAFQARLERLDLGVLVDPDPDAEDRASVLLPALSTIRRAVSRIVLSDAAASELFSLVALWLTEAESSESLQADEIDACIREFAMLCADFEGRCRGHERSTGTRAEWAVALLSALVLGSRTERTDHFNALWKLAPGVYGRLVREGCEVRHLDSINSLLLDLAVARNAYAVFEASIQVNRKLVERTGDPVHRRDLAFRLATFGLLCTGEEEFDKAGELLTEALSISNDLTDENESVDNLRELSRVLEGLETLSRHTDDFDKAAGYLSRRREVLERLVEVSEGRIGRDELQELEESVNDPEQQHRLLH